MVSTATLAETIAAELRDAIASGRYMQGERLVEIALARELGVSQNSVRDALSMLEQEGWVVRQARRGVFVRRFTEAEASEVYALVGAVEGVALEWTMDALTKPRLTELRQHIIGARRAARRGDSYAAVDALFAFHEALGTASGKPLTAQLLSRLYNYVRLLEVLRQARTPRSPEELDAQISAHEALLKRIEDGDRDGAHMALLSQLASYREMIVRVLAWGG